MRELVSAPGIIGPRADAFAAEVVQLSAVIASLQETGVAPSVKRAAQDLSLGFIAPVADGGNAGLVIRQDQVMQTVRDSVAAQSAALTTAADEILAEPRVEPRRFVPLSAAEAVIRYWSDFIPSWAGAISIDLLPVVLVLVLMVVHDAMRREASSMEEADTMTAAEMLRAVSIYRQMQADAGTEAPETVVVAEAAPPAEKQPELPAAKDTPDATVTPIEVRPAQARRRTDAHVTAAAEKRGVVARLAAISDGAILRTAFYTLLAGTLTVLYIDYNELTQSDVTGIATPFQPVLPAFDPDSPDTAPGPAVTTDFDTLRQPLSIVLGNGGILRLTGTIDPGASDRFAAEVEARGEYVTTVAFDSPGGSVVDAMAIGTLISELGLATSVDAGALCASSCPLAFAGGRERQATPQSAIGVHQVYATVAGVAPTGLNAAGDAMSDAQRDHRDDHPSPDCDGC